MSLQTVIFWAWWLAGVQLPLPVGFRGNVLQRASNGHEHKQPWSSVSSFDSFTYWSHDATPIKTDPLRKIVDWLELSQKVSCFCVAFVCWQIAHKQLSNAGCSSTLQSVLIKSKTRYSRKGCDV